MKIVAGLSVPEVGDLVSITHDGITARYTVEAELAGGRYRIRSTTCPAALIVSATSISPVLGGDQAPAVTRHRATDMDTARAAADRPDETLTRQQRSVLVAIADAGKHGLLDHDHKRRNGLGQTSAGVRRKELCRMGLVEDSGERRQTGTGHATAAAWRVTAAGLEVVAHMRARGVA